MKQFKDTNYYVTKCGKVFNKKGKELNQQIHNGRSSIYKRVKLYHNGMSKNYRIHRLVALVYLENPDKKKEVDHIDGDTFNNQLENLEWITRSENQKRAIERNKE